jgi:ubiquitin-small subunit ribosomal protein S27Ae
MAATKDKKKKSMKIWKLYQVSGGKAERKNKICSKCGAGVFLAKHKDRETCGRCGYTTFSKP